MWDLSTLKQISLSVMRVEHVSRKYSNIIYRILYSTYCYSNYASLFINGVRLNEGQTLGTLQFFSRIFFVGVY